MERLICLNCGEPLHVEGGFYVCRHCGATYRDDQAEKAQELLQEVLDSLQIENLAKARRSLYEATHAKYPSRQVVLHAAMNVLALSPEDFLARVYLHSHDGDPTELIHLLAHGNVTPVEALESFRWLIRSLDHRIVGAVKDFASRHLEGKEKTEALNLIENEAAKLDGGVYELSLKRDVFLCYSTEDMPRVIEILDVIESNGLTCFAAFRNLRHGKGAQENYQSAIFAAMKNCRVFVFLSSHSSRSPDRTGVVEELDHLISDFPDKPRIEFLLDDYPAKLPILAKRRLADAFPHLEHCRDEDDLVLRIAASLNTEETAAKERARKIAEEAAEKARRELRAEYEAKEAERKRLQEEAERRHKEEEARKAKEAAEKEAEYKKRLEEEAARAKEEQRRREELERELEERRLKLEADRLELEKAKLAAQTAPQGGAATTPMDAEGFLRMMEEAERIKKEKAEAERLQKEKERQEKEEAERKARQERAEQLRREEEERRRQAEEEARRRKADEEEKARKEQEAKERSLLLQRQQIKNGLTVAYDGRSFTYGRYARQICPNAFLPFLPDGKREGDYAFVQGKEFVFHGGKWCSSEPIHWTLVRREGDRAFLISKEVLDCRVYDNSGVGFAFSAVRKWMKDVFLRMAFPDASAIIPIAGDPVCLPTQQEIASLGDVAVKTKRTPALEALFPAGRNDPSNLSYWTKTPVSANPPRMVTIGVEGQPVPGGSRVFEQRGVRPLISVRLDPETVQTLSENAKGQETKPQEQNAPQETNEPDDAAKRQREQLEAEKAQRREQEAALRREEEARRLYVFTEQETKRLRDQIGKCLLMEGPNRFAYGRYPQESAPVLVCQKLDAMGPIPQWGFRADEGNLYQYIVSTWYLVKPIHWIVLSRQGDAAFAIAEDILDARSFPAGNSDEYSSSSLHHFLNHKFLDDAFPDGGSRLFPVRLTALIVRGPQDKVAPLDERWMDEEGFRPFRKGKMTDYAFNMASSKEFYGLHEYWILSKDGRARGVTSSGSVYKLDFYKRQDLYKELGVRPCIKVKLP